MTASSSRSHRTASPAGLRRGALLFAFFAAQTFVGCPCFRNEINANESTRWYLFSNVAAQRICPEMLNSGVPLAVPLAGPASVGRFFPNKCNVNIDEANKVIVVNLAGTGYAHLPGVRRVGFFADVSVEYRPDFQLLSDSIYVWGKYSRTMKQPVIQLTGTENAAVGMAYMTPFGSVADLLGRGVFQSTIGKGFTVVRQEDGDDFALDILTPPRKPTRQFQPGDDAKVLASDQTEVQPSARQYLGPFTVPGNGQKLTLRYREDNTPLNWFVVERQTGNAWLQDYASGRALGGPRGPILATGQLPVGTNAVPMPVNAGQYYIVVENPGATNILSNLGLPVGAPNGYLSYTVEVGAR